MKKIIISLLVLALMLAPLSVLTSCSTGSSGPTKTDSINGLPANEAFVQAETRLNTTTRYEVRMGFDVKAQLLFIRTTPLDVAHLLTTSYDGDNMAYTMNPDAMEDLGALSGLLDGSGVFNMEESFYYIDGMLYTSTAAEGKVKYPVDIPPHTLSNYTGPEDMVADIIEKGYGEVRYYTEGERQYFTIEITDDAQRYFAIGNRETYTVYLTKDGLPEEIRICIALRDLLGGAADGALTLYAHYIYDGLSPITLPADADEYRDYEY